ncbi:Uncharacterised protein [uncultured archaeon]|nr:Uncharacterised protein [uncultured archaeon]
MKKIIIIAILAIFLISMASGANPVKVKEVREKHEPELFAIEGVSGVSVDEENNEIIVYIEKPEISKKVPKVLDGFHVRHKVIGRIEALQTISAIEAPFAAYQTLTFSRTGSYNPVFGGISVGNPYITAGTLGLVTNDGSGKPIILSNAHVLALNSQNKFLPLGTPIYQPGPYDGGNSLNKIGVLSKYIGITFNSYRANNKADAAIATLSIPGNKNEILNETNDGFYIISGTTTVSVNDIVRKSGRTTGVTTGIVTDTAASVKVSYGGKWAIFKDQIIVSNLNSIKFSDGGDSGSAVDKDGKFIGLLFAGSSTTTVVNKAGNVLAPLGINV